MSVRIASAPSLPTMGSDSDQDDLPTLAHKYAYAYAYGGPT